MELSEAASMRAEASGLARGRAGMTPSLSIRLRGVRRNASFGALAGVAILITESGQLVIHKLQVLLDSNSTRVVPL
eukprot:5901413-Amphidinium_carterae.2